VASPRRPTLSPSGGRAPVYSVLGPQRAAPRPLSSASGPRSVRCAPSGAARRPILAAPPTWAASRRPYPDGTSRSRPRRPCARAACGLTAARTRGGQLALPSLRSRAGRRDPIQPPQPWPAPPPRGPPTGLRSPPALDGGQPHTHRIPTPAHPARLNQPAPPHKPTHQDDQEPPSIGPPRPPHRPPRSQRSPGQPVASRWQASPHPRPSLATAQPGWPPRTKPAHGLTTNNQPPKLLHRFTGTIT